MLRFGGDMELGNFSKNALRNISGFAIQNPRKLQHECKLTVLTVAVIKSALLKFSSAINAVAFEHVPQHHIPSMSCGRML